MSVRAVAPVWATLSRQISHTRMSPALTATPVSEPVVSVPAVSLVPGSVTSAAWSYSAEPTIAPVPGRHTYRQNVGWKLAAVFASALAIDSVHVPVGSVCAASGADSHIPIRMACAVVVACVVPTREVCETPMVVSMERCVRLVAGGVALVLLTSDECVLDGSVPVFAVVASWK